MSIVETRKWVHSMALALVTLGLTASLALAYALPAAAEAGRVAPAARPVVPISRTDPATRDARVERALARMTLPEKIGQMLLIGTHHKELRPSMERLLQRYHFGALIYFDWNMDSPAQVARYSAQLQGARGSRLPLFIAIDEEGGRVARMKHALPAPPSQQQLGRTGRPELAEQSAFDISGKLLAMGINLNFAPVADVGTGNTRYFSADPQQAADFVQAAARGYSRAGMLYTLKHFPGLGRGVVDTHVAGSRVPATRAELDACDLVPFQRMIATGADDCLIMVSHLTFPALDEGHPSSMSHAVMTDLLRQELGFDGLIVTDDMGMGAIASHYEIGDAAVQAVQAGADIVLTVKKYANMVRAHEALLDAVRTGKLTEARIDESVRRILRVKLAYLAEQAEGN